MKEQWVIEHVLEDKEVFMRKENVKAVERNTICTYCASCRIFVASERECKLFNQEPVLPMSLYNIRFKHNRGLVSFSIFRSHGRAWLRLSGIDGGGVVVQLLHQTHSVDMSLERPAPDSHFHSFTPKPVIKEELGSQCLGFLNSLGLKAMETVVVFSQFGPIQANR